MSRIIRQATLWLFVLLLAGCSSKKPPELVWIGHLTPLSGVQRTRGEAAIQSMQLVLEKAKADDWSVAGRSLGVRHVDGAEMARAEAVRLLAVNRVAGLILGPGLGDPDAVAAVARTHEAAAVVLDEVPSRLPDPVVLLGPDPARRGRALARLARTQLKKKRAALLIDRRDRLCSTLGDAFAGAWRKKDGELREWSPDASRSPMLKSELAEFAPEVVLAAVPAAHLGEAASFLPRVAVLYGGPDEDEEILKRQLAAIGGHSAYTATAWTTVAKLSDSGRDWRQRYEKTTHEVPGRDAALACDGLLLMMAALDRAGGRLRTGSSALDFRKHLRENLLALTERAATSSEGEGFEGVTGPLRWSEGMAVRPLFLVHLTAGKTRVEATVTGDED